MPTKATFAEGIADLRATQRRGAAFLRQPRSQLAKLPISKWFSPHRWYSEPLNSERQIDCAHHYATVTLWISSFVPNLAAGVRPPKKTWASTLSFMALILPSCRVFPVSGRDPQRKNQRGTKCIVFFVFLLKIHFKLHLFSCPLLEISFGFVLFEQMEYTDLGCTFVKEFFSDRSPAFH